MVSIGVGCGVKCSSSLAGGISDISAQSADAGNGRANAGNLGRFLVLPRGQPGSVPRRSPQFDKAPVGLVRPARAQVTIPEWKFVPRFRKARRSQRSLAHRLAFLKRSLALPRIRRRPLRVPVQLGKYLQQMRLPAPALSAGRPAHMRRSAHQTRAVHKTPPVHQIRSVHKAPLVYETGWLIIYGRSKCCRLGRNFRLAVHRHLLDYRSDGGLREIDVGRFTGTTINGCRFRFGAVEQLLVLAHVSPLESPRAGTLVRKPSAALKPGAAHQQNALCTLQFGRFFSRLVIV